MLRVFWTKKFLTAVFELICIVLYVVNKKRHTGSLSVTILHAWRKRPRAWKLLCDEKKRKNRYTRCQFHLVLCAVNRTINHYAEGFTVMAYRSRTVGITLAICMSHLRCVDLMRSKWNERFDVAAIYFRVDSTRSLQREHSMQTCA